MERVKVRTKIKWYFWRTVVVVVFLLVFFGVGGILERIM